MKLSQSVFLAVLASASAGPISVARRANRGLEDADYDVEGMNEENGNFQYYDADGQYDESYAQAGYYDEQGNFYFYDNDFDATYNGTYAEQYVGEWNNVGGVYGYYDAESNWVQSNQNANTLPCQSYDSKQISQYKTNGGNTGGNAQQDGEVADGYVYEYDVEEACADNLRIRTSNCENLPVEVTKVTILCDSPYRGSFYTGNHMASQLCEYGDQAVVMVYFDVKENLHYLNTMYMTLGIYAGKKTKELLWAVRSVELCDTFVGHDCTTAGNYAFAFQVSFDYGQLSDRAMFVPMIEMGISTRADEGYNLGGVNIDCQFNAFYQKHDPWFNGKAAHASQQWGAGGLGKASGRFGLILGALLAGCAYGLVTYYRKKKQGIEFQGNADTLVVDGEETAMA